MTRNLNADLTTLLIVGSAPDAVQLKDWDAATRSIFTHIVTINHAWQICPYADYVIYAEDFPVAHRPPQNDLSMQHITAEQFMVEHNRLGGMVYAGGTMAFTAGYWALGALQPDVIAYLGCDMEYSVREGQATHFYGTGQADPLRADVTLQSLEAKSARLMALAEQHGCSVVNLSTLPQSRLVFPRVSIVALQSAASSTTLIHTLTLPRYSANTTRVAEALALEHSTGAWVASGRYWDALHTLDAKQLAAIDTVWLAAVRHLPLTQHQLALAMTTLSGWTLEATTATTATAPQKLCKTWRLPNFASAVALFVAISQLAEQHNHHPECLSSYTTLTVTLWTHDVHALTQQDIDLAHAIDACWISLHPNSDS